MRKKYKRDRKVKLKTAVQVTTVSLAFVFLFLLCCSRIDPSTFLLSESLPGVFRLFQGDNAMYKFADGAADTPQTRVQIQAQPQTNTQPQAAYKNNEDSSLLSVADVVGVNDVDLEPETESQTMLSPKQEAISFGDINKLRDLSYLKQNFYIVDSRTGMTADDFNADEMLNANLKLDMSQPGPKVLIFHTHSQEMYADSEPGNLMDGVAGTGEKLAEILSHDYGIETLHDTETFDIVNGQHQIEGAYERMEPVIERILKEHPSIQAAIDIHRDGVPNGAKLVTDINGVSTAQVMFFDGLCMEKNKKGTLIPYSQQNPYLKTNLALSFNAQLTANSLFPDFTRKIYLCAYRYSTNMLPKSMLIEVGAQTSTKEEAFNAMGPLAEVLSRVLQ